MKHALVFISDVLFLTVEDAHHATDEVEKVGALMLGLGEEVGHGWVTCVDHHVTVLQGDRYIVWRVAHGEAVSQSTEPLAGLTSISSDTEGHSL